MGYTKETQIYVASGQVYGGNNRMAPLRNMFPNLVGASEVYLAGLFFSCLCYLKYSQNAKDSQRRNVYICRICPRNN
jgi:hypothetical protein